MPKYGIFSGAFGDDDATWLESVEGLEAACERMEEIAKRRPGKYFIFSPTTKEAVASIDTTKKEQSTGPLGFPIYGAYGALQSPQYNANSGLRYQKVKDYLKRTQDVIRAVQGLQRLGLSVSLPYQTASGQMFFEIDGHALTVAQLLRSFDENQLNRVGISQFIR